MSRINIRELSKLVNSKKSQRDYELTAQLFRQKYDIKVLDEDFWLLVQTANRINKREKERKVKDVLSQEQETYQIFGFGQLKLFNWVLILYSHSLSLDLPQYQTQNFTFLQTIFKRKSQLFIEFQIREIMSTKTKTGEQWTQQQIQILQQVIKKRQDEAEWKAISFQFFRNSGRKYFRSYMACREKWINYLNPNIKKGEWTLQQEIQLFTLISTYGCRWALISKELKGSRSEHNIKNKYNSMVRTIKKQHRVTQTSQLCSKVLKYLKMRQEKQIEKQSKKSKKMNKSVISADSLSSRDRSRQLNKNRLNDSMLSGKSNSLSELNESLDKEVKQQKVQHRPMSILEDCNFEIKEEKKTNDREQNQESDELTQLKEQKSSEEVTRVRMLTLGELQSEYNRLLNFNNESNCLDLLEEDSNFQDILPEKNSWAFENELYGYSWYNLDA